jgi:hypothetical protein
MAMNIAGFSLVNWINYGLSFVEGSVSWRFPLAFQFVFICILFATVPWLPESPRFVQSFMNVCLNVIVTNLARSWLIAHDRTDEAIEIIGALEAKPKTDPFVTAQLHEIESSVKYELEHSIPWTDILLRRNREAGDTKTLRRLLLGANTQFMQQLQGINVMSYYMPTVLIQSVGLSERMARLLSAINSVSYLIFSSAAVLLVEKWGRRGLMLVSTAGQLLAFLVITVLLSLAESSTNGEVYSKASIAFFFLFFIAFGIGMLGVPWLYPTEINSLPMRTKGAAVATGTNWFVLIPESSGIGCDSNCGAGSQTSSWFKSRQLECKTSTGASGLSGP